MRWLPTRWVTRYDTAWYAYQTNKASLQRRDLIVVVVIPGPLPFQDEDVEGGEGGGVEPERLRVVVYC